MYRSKAFGKEAFVDVQTFNSLTKTSFSKQLKTSYKANENEKNQTIQIEHKPSIPLVFSTFGGVSW